MNNQGLVSDFGRFNSPPPPPNFSGQPNTPTPACLFCIRCDASSQVTQQSFKRAYVNPVMYITVLLGPLIGVLLLMLLRVQHEITLPYCQSCWRGFKKANLFESLSVLSFFLSIVVGVVLMLNLNSGAAFFVPLVISVALIVIARRNKMRFYPKFKKVDRKQAIVDAGRYGDVVFSKVTKVSTATML